MSNCGAAGYEADDTWQKLPAGWSWNEATSVAVDSQDRVFVFNRGEHPVIAFDSSGKFLNAWGEGQFTRPHGITIDRDDNLWLADDAGHVIRKYTPDGNLLLTLGTPGKPSDSGAVGLDFRTIQRSAGPFNYPCNVAIGSNGDIFVCDGYGNARIHVFSAEGTLLRSWGEPGAGPGQFHIPHGIAFDPEMNMVYVADRENSRIQRFTPEGTYVDEWIDVARPCQVCIVNGLVYVAELGFKAGMWPGTQPPTPGATGGRVSIFDLSGEFIARWGGGANPAAPGDFFAPHGIAVDSNGNIYVAEVTMSAGGNRGLVSPDCHSLQKFWYTNT